MQPFTIQFWRKHDDPAALLKEVRQRYKENATFARLLHAAVLTTVHGGEVVIEGKPNAQRVLRHVLGKLLEQERADVPTGKAGKWQYLELKPQPYTQKRVWQKVSRVRAWTQSVTSATPDLPFTLTRVLGYPGNVTRKQAKLIERAHAPRFIVLVEEPEEQRDTAHDLDPNDNEHFRDDSGVYDEAGVLQPRQSRARENWETAYQTKHEAWNGVREDEAAQAYRFGSRFYAAPIWSTPYRRVDWHGAMKGLEYRDHLTACRGEREALARRQALAPHPADGPWWTLSDKQHTALHLASAQFRACLGADDLEVQARALTDVPQTDLELLEEQVQAVQNKAPQGLIAALAHERLKAQRHAEAVRQQQTGLTALEQAVAPLPFAAPPPAQRTKKERLPAQSNVC